MDGQYLTLAIMSLNPPSCLTQAVLRFRSTTAWPNVYPRSADMSCLDIDQIRLRNDYAATPIHFYSALDTSSKIAVRKEQK